MNSIPRETRIEAPARLHLGFLDPSASRGRRFGSVGLAIDGLSTIVNAVPYAATEVQGPMHARAAEHLAAVYTHYALDTPLRVTVERAIPAHVGLGSGTQLALAVGAIALVAHRRACNAPELAALLGRARRSGIGTSLFEQGGLVVDGGHGPGTTSPPVIAHLAFPSAWRVVLVCDRAAEGLSGRAESAAFGALAPMPEALAARLCHTTLLGLLPAVAEQDFAAFGAALSELQTVAGDYFAAAQNGRYTSQRVGELLGWAEAHCGVSGVGQSSWGPTGFAFVESETRAADVAARLRARAGAAEGLEILVCAARNHGARLSVDDESVPARAPQA